MKVHVRKFEKALPKKEKMENVIAIPRSECYRRNSQWIVFWFHFLTEFGIERIESQNGWAG